MFSGILCSGTCPVRSGGGGAWEAGSVCSQFAWCPRRLAACSRQCGCMLVGRLAEPAETRQPHTWGEEDRHRSRRTGNWPLSRGIPAHMRWQPSHLADGCTPWPHSVAALEHTRCTQTTHRCSPPGPSFMTCTSFSQARRVSSPWVSSSANCAASLASAEQNTWGGRSANRGHRQVRSLRKLGGSISICGQCKHRRMPLSRHFACRAPWLALQRQHNQPDLHAATMPPTVLAARAQAVADGKSHVVAAADVQDVICCGEAGNTFYLSRNKCSRNKG